MTEPPLTPSDDASDSTDAPHSWQESPWVWFGVFAAVALVALVAIAPKYAQRQGRLEQRYENRVEMERQRVAPATQSSEPTRMADARARTSLWPLAAALLLVFVASAAILLHLRARRMADSEAADVR